MLKTGPNTHESQRFRIFRPNDTKKKTSAINNGMYMTTTNSPNDFLLSIIITSSYLDYSSSPDGHLNSPTANKKDKKRGKMPVNKNSKGRAMMMSARNRPQYVLVWPLARLIQGRTLAVRNMFTKKQKMISQEPVILFPFRFCSHCYALHLFFHVIFCNSRFWSSARNMRIHHGQSSGKNRRKSKTLLSNVTRTNKAQWVL